MTGLTVTFVRESPTPVLDLVEEHQPLTLLHPPGRAEHRVQPVESGVEVGVQHDLAGGGQTLDVPCAGGALGVEVEGGLGAGEVAEGGGAAGVERGRRPEGLQARGAVGEGAVEVEGVGDVELGLEAHGAGVVHVVGVEGGVAGVDVEVAVLRIRGRVDVGEVEPLDRLGDQPVQLRRTDPAGDGGDLGVDEPGGLDRQGRGRVDGGLGDRAGPPRRNPAGVDLRPQPREAVAQLEGVADELLRRGRRDTEDGAELGEAELRHQRRTLTRDGLLVLTTRDGERSRVVDRLRRVQVGPLRSQDELGRCRALFIDALSMDRGQDCGGGEVRDLPCLRPCQRLDHVFDSIGHHRQ